MGCAIEGLRRATIIITVRPDPACIRCEIARLPEVEAKARANSAVSEFPAKDLLYALYRVSDALPPRQPGPS